MRDSDIDSLSADGAQETRPKRVYPPNPETPIGRLASRLEVPVDWLKHFAATAGVILTERGDPKPGYCECGKRLPHD